MTMRASWVFLSLLLGCAGSTGSDASGSTPAAPPDALPAAPSAAAPSGFAKDDKAAVAAALKEKGVELGEDACFAWPASFPRVVAVGAFAHDRGCGATGIFVDRTWREVDGEVEGLASRGWADASPSERRALARAWVLEVAQAFGGQFITEREPAFDLGGSPKYVPITVRDADGVVEVEGWVREPPGMRDETAYERVVYRIDAKGKMKVERLSGFAVPGEVLRAAKKK